TRRNFLSAAATAGAMSLVPADSAFGAVSKVSDQALEKAAAKPVLDLKSFKEPIIIEAIQLLKKGRNYFVRVRSKDGAEGVSVDNGRLDILHPILHQLVVP